MQLFYGTAAQRFDEGRHGVKSLHSCAAWGEHFGKKGNQAFKRSPSSHVDASNSGHLNEISWRLPAGSVLHLAVTLYKQYSTMSLSVWLGTASQFIAWEKIKFSCGIYLAQVTEKTWHIPLFLCVAVSTQTLGPSTWPCYTDTAANSTRSWR